MTSISQYGTAMYKGQLEPAFKGEAKNGGQDDVKKDAIDKIIRAATNADGKIDPNTQFGAALKVREWGLETAQWRKENPNRRETIFDQKARAEIVDRKVSNPVEATRIMKAELNIPRQDMDSNAASAFYGVGLGAMSASESVLKNADGTGNIPSQAHRESYQHLAEYMDIHGDKYGKPSDGAKWADKGDSFSVNEMQHIEAAGKDLRNEALMDVNKELNPSVTGEGTQRLGAAADASPNRLGTAPLPDETKNNDLPASLFESQRGQDIAQLLQKLAKLMAGEATAG